MKAWQQQGRSYTAFLLFISMLLVCFISSSAFTIPNTMRARTLESRAFDRQLDGDYAYDDLAGRINEWFHANLEDIEGLRGSVASVLENHGGDFGYVQLVESTQKVFSNLPSTADFMGGLDASSSTVIMSSAVLLIGLSQIPRMVSSTAPQPSAPYLSKVYNPQEAKIYFDQKPVAVLQRSAQILGNSLAFGLRLLNDYWSGRLFDPETEKTRSQEVTRLLTALGPTFIKVGQSLSIRRDLLRPAYLDALSKLQDQVPAFSSTEAVAIIEKELGRPVDEIFSSGMSKNVNVVAAASLGQVYRARLRVDNTEVAVKVQRPNVLENVALDMHILRTAAPLVKSLAGLQSDLVGIVDDWGTGFVNELDYLKEAYNGDLFTDSIKKTSLKDVVFAPAVMNEYCSDKVLVTEWVQGDRLDRSSPENLNTACAVAMTTYLTMMLETGVLHCDPHPGNLLRTPDGRLCILDWGLVTSLNPDLQLTFIEHIAHLTSKDYAKVPEDLVKLGFIPAGKEAVALESGVVSVLSEVYTEFAGGGGAAKIDVNAVISKLGSLADTYGNIFQVPPYFAYIAKAFGVLEGIGLTSDPDYAIVGECLPYISQRMLSDMNPRTGEALKTFIFGAQKDSADRVFDADRMELLIKGFSSYSSTSNAINLGTTAISNHPKSVREKKRGGLTFNEIEFFADSIVDLVLADIDSSIAFRANRTPLQRLVIEEVSKLISAFSRQQWRALRDRSGRLPTGRSILGTIIDPFGLFESSPMVEVDNYDLKILESSEKVLKLTLEYIDQKELVSTLASSDAQRFLVRLTQKFWNRRRNVFDLGTGVAAQILENTILRLNKRDNINTNIAVKTSLGSNK